MSKYLVIPVLSLSTLALYTKVTAFETNVIITDKEVKPFLFNRFKKCYIGTDKGAFVSYKPTVFNELKINEAYHVSAFGLNYPDYMCPIIYNQIGTPCNLAHCQEKESIVSTVFNKI